MQLQNTSWIVKIAYLFTQQDELPTHVDRCSLWQRFCVMLVPWIVVNILAWFVGGLLLGIIGQPVWRLILFVIPGQTLLFQQPRPYGTSSSIVGADTLTHLNILFYRPVKIGWLRWLERVGVPGGSPILFALILFVGTLAAILVYTNVPTLVYMLWDVITMAGTYVYQTSGWWGSGLLVLVALGLCWYGTRRGYKTFAATPSGAVILSHVREWKEQHCTIIELV